MPHYANNVVAPAKQDPLSDACYNKDKNRPLATTSDACFLFGVNNSYTRQVHHYPQNCAADHYHERVEDEQPVANIEFGHLR